MYSNHNGFFDFKESMAIINELIKIQSQVVRDDLIIPLNGERVAVDGIKGLSLNGRGVRELPKNIGILINLQVLDIRNAQMNELPESIGNLVNLRELYLVELKISKLPESIGNLSNLQNFNLSGTQISKLPESIGNLYNLQKLQLGSTKICEVPESIGKLSGLCELGLVNTQISQLPDSVWNLSNLEKLDLSRTNIREISEKIGNLINLRRLIINNTQISELPQSITNLTNLQYIKLYGTQISKLPEDIGNLFNLQELDLSDTKIREVPESIGKLSRLYKLRLNNTQISELPDNIWDLGSLGVLDLGLTEISKVPESIGKLSRLYKLRLSNTQISELPDNIWNLSNLKELYLSQTRICELSEKIEKCINLETLYIGNTQISELPESLGNLSKLRSLDLSDLTLSRIDKSLAEGFFFFDDFDLFFNFDGIYIHGLTLKTQPFSLYYQKRELIEQYFSEEMISINSAKIIFLGDGEVGKTYTLKRLLNDGKKATADNPYKTQTTHGVLIKPYHVNNGDKQYDMKLWDFGGQQIMHSMHRCFLTERSCYVVMLSTRTDRDLLGQARYWLQTVNSFAPNAPVIVFVNQWTKNLIRVDEFRLRKEFKNIKEFLYFSVVEADDEQFLTLKDSIMNQVHQLDCYGMEFPKSWYGLMTDLEKESEKRNYIPKSDYYRMCFERGLRYEDKGEEGIYDWLLDWFNDLGVCFSYNKNSNSQRLDNYELLNPQWLTRAAYVLINNGEAFADNGILTKKQIGAVLTNTEPLDFDDLGSVSYKQKEIEYVLEILRKFRISYQLPDGRELIPVLCNENSSGSARPEWFIPGKMQHTSYEFQYKYLPDTIIHRLMIFCYQGHYVVRDRWRKGMRVDFSSDDTKLTAIIDSGNDNQSISIDIYSDGHIPCWEFLSKLREEILQINAELGIKASDYINMETDGIKDQFSVEAVLKRRARGKTDYPAKNYDGDYEIRDILGSAYGAFNTTIMEKVTENTVITGDSLNQILSAISQLKSVLEKLDDRSKNTQIVQYLIKDQMADELAKVLQSQDELTALLNTLNKQPSKIKQLGKRILSGAAVTADIVTIVEASNPGMTKAVCIKVAETISMILPRLMAFLA